MVLKQTARKKREVYYAVMASTHSWEYIERMRHRLSLLNLVENNLS